MTSEEYETYDVAAVLRRQKKPPTVHKLTIRETWRPKLLVLTEVQRTRCYVSPWSARTTKIGKRPEAMQLM
jgi:hypothetical protein